MIDWNRPDWGHTANVHTSASGSELDAEPKDEDQ